MAPKRLLAATVVAGLCIALWPSSALAQRRAVRVQRVPSVVVVRPPYVYDPWWGPWGGWYGPYGPYGPYEGRYLDNSASLRLQVTPKTAEVYVDGYYAGTVDQFDGTFQRLHLEAGSHDVVVFAEGFRTLTQRQYFQPRSTVTIKQNLEPLRPGDVQDVRPSPPPAPPAATSAPPPRVPGRAGRPVPRPRTRPAPEPPREPSSAPPPSASDNAAFGVLSIRVQPNGADVIIDGDRWEGPDGDERLLVQLAPGAHQVEIRRAGYQSFTRTIEIRSGETEALNVSLPRQ